MKGTYIGQRLLAWLLLMVSCLPGLTAVWVSFSMPKSDGGIGGFGTLAGWHNLRNLGLDKLVLQTVAIGCLAALFTVVVAARVSAEIRLWRKNRRQWIVRLVAAPLLVDLVVRSLAVWRLLENIPGEAASWSAGLPLLGNMLWLWCLVACAGLIYTYFPYVFLVFWSSAEALDEQLFAAARDLGGNRTDLVALLTQHVFARTKQYCWVILSISMAADAVVPYVFGSGRVIMAAQGIDSLFFRLKNWPASAAFALIVVASAATASIIGVAFGNLAKSAWRSLKGFARC